MFAKTLVAIAATAMTAEAVKIKSGLSANALVGVNVRSLSKAELSSLLTATQDQFNTYCSEHGKHYLAEEECTVRHTNWLESEAYNQSHNANDNSSAEFGHNQFSDMSQEEKDKVNGGKAPKDAGHDDSDGASDSEDEGDVELAQKSTSRYGFAIKMSTEEYQELYNEKWEQSDKTCERFDKQFNTKDNRYMARKEEKKRQKKLQKGWTEAEFDDWWMRIMQDRTVAQGSIERCFEDNNDDEHDEEENNDEEEEDNTDPEPEPQPECSASASEFIWGDNVVVPIKNQGQCGSCYSFSAMTVLEGAMAIKYNQQVQSLAEQQIVDCNSNYSNCQGCNGGWPVSLHQSTRQFPVVLTADYPYVARVETCKSPESTQNVSADDVYYVDGTANGVKEALCEGPITLTVKANGPFMSYSGGVMTSADCPYNNDLDHAVSAIGWKVMDGQEVLIVRNSWGTWWGVDGYIYMAMDDGNNGMGPCGIFHYPSSATVA